MPPAAGTIPSLFGADVRDPWGAPIGFAHDVLFDCRTNEPGWLEVDTGERLALVPAHRTVGRTGYIEVLAEAEAVRCAPAVPAEGSLDRAGGTVLARHYGVLLGSPGPWTGLTRASAAAKRDPGAVRATA